MEISEVNLNVDITSVVNKMHSWVYLLLTEFEFRTVSYGSSFFPLRFMARAKDEVSKIFLLYLYCVSDGFGNDSIHESGGKQNELIWNRF